MRRFLLFILVASIAGACANESSVDPRETSTFIRYINGGYDDIGVSVQETPDNGYIILANSSIAPNDVTGAHFKVKLIKMNAFGAVEWQRVYPEYTSDTYEYVVRVGAGTETRKYKISRAGYGLLILPDNAGYVVVGQDIKQDTSRLFMLSTNAQGENPVSVVISNPEPTNTSVSGRGVALNANGNLLVLAQSNNNMYLREYATATLTPVWSRTYAAGTVNNLVNKIFTNAQGNVYWGGTVTKESTSSKIRFVKTKQNSDLVESDPVIGNPTYNETGRDICRYGFGFAVIGTTNQKETGAGDRDILFRRLAEDGSEVIGQTKTFPVGGIQADGKSSTDLLGNEEGNSIYATQDGGLILLGTVDSQVGTSTVSDSRGNAGRGETDMYLIKIDPFGEVAWQQIYGSKFEDTGSSVIQSRDGGFVVLGTANISNAVRTIVLMKTDKEGRIQ